jgi:predicted outer membrane protein
MLRRIPRFLRRAVLVAVVLAVSVSVYQSWSAGSPGTGGWTQTQWGPLGPADRDLIVKVRLAGLWEGPTGQQAEEQATSPAVREVGAKLAAEHADLDRQVRDVASQLGVVLPASPNATQVQWMADISSRTGTDYDREFIQVVRAAHGQILPAIAAVRSGTRNDKVRAFAEVAASFVTRHHDYLESTGLVDYAALPTPPSPGLLSGGTDPKDLILPIVVFVLTILGAIALFSALRSRGSARPARVTAPGAAAAAAGPIPALATVAAVPGSRSLTERRAPVDAPMLEAGPSHRGRSDTGSYRSVNTGTHRAYDTGSYRPVDPEYHEAPRNGPMREYRSSETGTYRPVTGETETFRAITDSDVFQPVHDTGGYRAVTDSGGYDAVSESGDYPAVHDSEGYRAVAEPGSGSRRPGSRSRARHSTRR